MKKDLMKWPSCYTVSLTCYLSLCPLSLRHPGPFLLCLSLWLCFYY